MTEHARLLDPALLGTPEPSTERPTKGGPVLEAIGIHKKYGRHEVLRGVTFEVDRGDVKVVLGPSGSGKSTMLRCLALLEPIDDGEVRLEGQTIGVRRSGDRTVRLPERELAHQRSDIGMVFQRFNLFPHLTALGNVMLGLTEVRHRSKEDARKIAADILGRVGLGTQAGFYPSELSGGQQQRVAIARALVTQPTLLLADEPTGNLDSRTSVEVMALFQALNEQGITVIIVTHEPDIAQYAHRVIDVRDGRILKDHVVAAPRRAADDLLALDAEAEMSAAGETREAA